MLVSNDRWRESGSVLAGTGQAQRHRDPFTQAEIDQIRDTSWEPQLRLGLYVKFARARLVGMEEMRADPKTKIARNRRMTSWMTSC